MIDESPNINSADKILEAATKLFAMDSFAAVSIKQISVASGVNSALISYYFGGKKNLYQEVLYTEAEKFLKLQDKIRQILYKFLCLRPPVSFLRVSCFEHFFFHFPLLCHL